MIRWTRWTLPLAALALGACTPPPDEVSLTTDGSSTGPGGPSTMTSPNPTMSGDGTVGTQGGTGADTTMGAVDTTAGVPTTDGETTMSVDPTVGSSGPMPECMGAGDCPNNETCTMGECVDACGGAWGLGTYDPCLTPLGVVDIANLCGASHTCLVDDYPIGATTCSGQACVDACDCPAPPATGNATVTCTNITEGMTNDCYLSCENGETCPDGMVCQNDGKGAPLLCMTLVQPLPMYGNCDDIAAPCMGGECATSGSHSVCVSLCPGGIGDCDPAPPGASLGTDCGGVIYPPDGSECHLDCNGNGDCPEGMDCIETNVIGPSTLCMWP